MALTPYELGQEIAHIQIHSANISDKDVEKATNIARLMGLTTDQEAEFMEGYLNRFEAGMPPDEEPDDEDPPWLPNATEIEEIEEEPPVDEYDPSLCYCGDGFCQGCEEADQEIAEEENALMAARRAQKAIGSPAWQAYLRGEFDR